MQVKSQMVIKGATFFDGQIDGKQLSSGSIFVEEQMDESTGNAKGFRTVEHKCKSADVVKSVFHNSFPMLADVSLDLIVKKGTQSFVVMKVEPIKSVNPAPKVS
jgi:hypothetical protein